MTQNIRFEDWEAEQMRDPEFRAAVEKLEPEYQEERRRMINQLPAHEMDALVAEKVMGRIPCDKWTPVLHPEVGWLKNCQCQACYPVGNPACYSTNIAAAWQVVEHLAESNIYLCIFDQLGYAIDEETGDVTNDCLFRVEFINAIAHEREESSERIWLGIAEAKTAPLAICRAALGLGET